uniref:RHO family interacting cell polarization regulator 1 n=2 Tax=Oryzias latipes TaxID=8090 RepID=A0A3P9III4_ORYLA
MMSFSPKSSWSPSRALSTMSLSARPVRRLTSRSITRSQSFTGVNSQDKLYRNLAVFSTPGLSRKPSRASRMFTMSTKSNAPPKVPQPERLDEIYEALKKGLQSYIHLCQKDLDGINRQIKKSKRNSRLGFLYEQDKQVKVMERFIRRLEFHLSKVEEHHETYCLVRRLRDGADKMIKAYTASPGSKEAKESLAEANKSYKEYTERMCVLENELESQLGEFHIRMKGLAGFARLCTGDQYEVLLKYGRQRWKLRGQMEMNDKQVWDGEKMLFVPLIGEFLSVKVTELKSLANHVVVGNVSCDMKDLFAPLPQMVAVDINDLGTIKLSLEVNWNPFDTEEPGGPISPMIKPTHDSSRFSIHVNPLPLDATSPPEQRFPKLIPNHNGNDWSNSSESSDNSLSPTQAVLDRCSSPHHNGSMGDPSVARTPSPMSDASQSEEPPPLQHPAKTHRKQQNPSVGIEEDLGTTSSHSSGQFSRSLSHISESSTNGAPMGSNPEVSSLMSELSVSDINMIIETIPTASPADITGGRICTGVETSSSVLLSLERPDLNAESDLYGEESPLPVSPDPMYAAKWVSVGEDTTDDPSREEGALPDCGLKDALGAVLSTLDDCRGQFPELHLLEQELRLLQIILKGGRHSHSPSAVSLTVETALGSFDFLDTSDWEKEDEEERSMRRNGKARSQPLKSWDNPASPPSPLTTGCTTLDCTLVVHLKNCKAQLLRLGTFGPLRCGEMYALDRLQKEVPVFEIIRNITKDDPCRLRQATEVIPQLGLCLGAVSLWQQCSAQGSVYCCSADTFLAALSEVYGGVLQDEDDTVLMHMTERILDQKLPRRGSSRDGLMVTLFQLWNYLEANGISDVETHVTELATEVWFVQKLESCDQDVILGALRHPPECSLKREGLQAVAKLLRDPRGKVSSSASSVLRGLVAQPRQRKQAVVSCLELLEDQNVNTRICGCKALACLKANESIDQLVHLCRTDKEEVRDAAKQTLLLLGEEGKMAHRHMEISQGSLPRFFAPGSMASTAF